MKKLLGFAVLLLVLCCHVWGEDFLCDKWGEMRKIYDLAVKINEMEPSVKTSALGVVRNYIRGYEVKTYDKDTTCVNIVSHAHFDRMEPPYDVKRLRDEGTHKPELLQPLTDFYNLVETQFAADDD